MSKTVSRVTGRVVTVNVALFAPVSTVTVSVAVVPLAVLLGRVAKRPDLGEGGQADRSLSDSSWAAAASLAGVVRSSTNVFHSWHWGHCHSSSVLR